MDEPANPQQQRRVESHRTIIEWKYQ